MPQLPDLLVDRLAFVIDLARVPTRPRQRMPLWTREVGERDSLEIALIVAYCTLSHPYEGEDERPGQLGQALADALGKGAAVQRKGTKPLDRVAAGIPAPSQQSVSLLIARALGMPDRDGETAHVRVGSGLLDLAENAGLIEIRRAHVKGEPKRVYLTEEAFEQLDDIAYRIATSKFRLPDEPREAPPTAPVQPGKNKRGLIPPEPLPPEYTKALDVIRGTPWRINQAVLNARAETSTKAQWHYTKAKWDQLCVGVRDEAQRSRLKQVDRLIALAIAAKQGESTFYLDVQLDYRGRIYHRGPLRFTGADHVIQPLLEFARGAKLTKSGAKHLAIYIGCLWGEKDFDKAEAWTYANKGLLLRVARNPKRHKKDWWHLNERKRWHFIAAADAWRRYLEKKKVHLPCSWDAVTSGLQIISLLMRDEELAKRVGLMWGSQGTYYEEVGATAGEERGAVKAVCIPLFYGAGLDQSVEDLTEWLETEGLEVVDVEARAEKIRNAAIKKARAFLEVRRWLSKVAKVFNDMDKPIRWRTPIGYRVVLDNRHYKLKDKIPIYFPKRRVVLAMQEPGPVLFKMKQATSITAAVVHSLDASYLVALVNRGTSDKIKSWGVVHDCFSVHPNDVRSLIVRASKMAIRDVFGKDWLAEEQDYLSVLHRDFKAQAGSKIPDPPKHPRVLSWAFQFGLESALTP